MGHLSFGGDGRHKHFDGFSSVDLKILDLLVINSRLNNSDIGKQVNLSKDSVAYHIKKLEGEGVIVKHRLFLKHSLLGLQKFNIFLRFNDFNLKLKKRFFDNLKDLKFVHWYCMFHGIYDLKLTVIVSDIRQLTFVINGLKYLFGEFIERLDILINTDIWRSFNLCNKTRLKKKRFSRGSFQDLFACACEKRVFLSEKDVRVLMELQKNSGAALSEVSVNTGVAVNTIYNCVRKLILCGAIMSFSTEKFSQKFNLSNNLVLVEFKKFDGDLKRDFKEYTGGLDFLTSVNEFSGRWDYTLEMGFFGTLDVNRFLEGFRERFGDRIRKVSVLSYTGEYGHVFNPLSLLLS